MCTGVCLEKGICDRLAYNRKDSDIVAMIEVVKEHRTLSILVDHTNFLKQRRDHCIVNLGPDVA